MTGPILALDLATNTGWCEGIPGEKPTFGSVRLAYSGGTNPEAYETLFKFMSDRFALTRYQMVIFEAPQSPSHMAGHSNAKTFRRLYGLVEMAEWVAHMHGYFGGRVREANVHDVRKNLLGARPPKGEAKKAVVGRLRGLGFDVKDDDAADAVAVWLYASALVDRKLAHATDPLFAGRSD